MVFLFQALLLIFPFHSLIFPFQVLLFPLQVVSESMPKIYIVPSALIGNTMTGLFITTRLHHRSDHQYIATISVRRGGLRHNAIWKQGDTWSGRLLDILTQWYGLVESLHGGNYNKENIVAAMMVSIIEDILLPDKTSIFFLLDDAINLF